MRVSTRQEILRIWSASVGHSYHEGKWNWGGRAGSNSISDAEQLLTVLYPASLIPSLRVDRPDLHTADDVVEALGALGGRFDIVHRLLDALVDYHERYRDADGYPIFTGGSYVSRTSRAVTHTEHAGDTSSDDQRTPSLAQQDLDLVDSMSLSLTLCLAAIGMAKTVAQASSNPTIVATCGRLESLASARLTAAMVGLLRSFSVRTFDSISPEADTLAALLTQGPESRRRVLQNVFDRLLELRASLRAELTIGTGQAVDELEDPTKLFECGWSWGIIKGAPDVGGKVEVGRRPAVAEDKPHVYFSVVALEGIQDLFSPRTRRLRLLDEEQQRLASALQLRWEWTQDYWLTVATFGDSRWPLEDVPWTTLDSDESEYYSLLITALVMARPTPRLATRDARDRLTGVLEELANRGRITRRPIPDDAHLRLHYPGLRIRLEGSDLDGEPPLEWSVTSFATMLFKRVFDLAARADAVPDRRRLLNLADEIWGHLRRRRLSDGPGAHLWDTLARVFPTIPPRSAGPSWYVTERVVEALVVAASLTEADPVPNPELSALAEGLVSEAEHLLDQFRLSGLADTGQMPTMLAEAVANLERSREIASRRPGSAYVLATDALRTLDRIAAAGDPRT